MVQRHILGIMEIILFELLDKESRQEIVYTNLYSDVEKYAKANNLSIIGEIKSYSPAMLLKYYKWIGSGNNPYVVSRPWKYKN